MTYRDRLNHWAITRLLPTHQWVVVARFHRRVDAEEHAKFLCQRIPEAEFKVVFDLANSAGSPAL